MSISTIHTRSLLATDLCGVCRQGMDHAMKPNPATASARASRRHSGEIYQRGTRFT